jgi:hypothetical protein
VTPARGTIAGDVTEVNVAGTVIDDSGQPVRVTVNGVPAELGYGGTWSARVRVTPGTTLLHVVATDSSYNQTTATRAIVAGPMISLDQRIASGVRAMISARASAAFARDAATFIESGDLSAALREMTPIADVGSDCQYARASIASVDVGAADVHIDPTAQGMATTVALADVRIGLRLQWADACAAGSRDVVATARSVAVTGMLVLGANERALALRLDDRRVEITGIDIETFDVPEKIVTMLALDDRTKTGLAEMTERLLGQPLVEPLARLRGTRMIEATTIEVDAAPTDASFSTDGGTYAFDMLLRARGADGQFVFVPNEVPSWGAAQGFEVAVADDVANQLLGSMWSVRAFDTKLSLKGGTYGAISQYYDSAELTLVVPPHVDATADAPTLTIGDWVVKLERGGEVTTVAIHATSGLYVVKRDDVKPLHIDISPRDIHVDIVSASAPVTKGQYEAIKAFAFGRIHASSKAALAALPLPVLGEPVLTNLWLEAQDGFLVIRGGVR